MPIHGVRHLMYRPCNALWHRKPPLPHPPAPAILTGPFPTPLRPQLLRQRVADYSSKLRSLAPHDPDFGQLVVAGEALEGQLEALAHAAVTLAEVEAHLRQHDPQGFKAYQAVKDEMEVRQRGPWR